VHVKDVEHMYMMRDRYSSCEWLRPGAANPGLDEVAALLTQTPYLDGDGDDPAAVMLEREDDRMTVGSVAGRLAVSSKLFPQTPHNHLPKIQAGDWMARVFGARRGDAVRFVRGSESGGCTSGYRHVV